MKTRLFTAAMALSFCLSGCGGHDDRTVDVPEEEMPKTVGYKVASIDEGGDLMPDDVKVVRIEYLLRDISKKTATDEEVIADQAAKTQQLLRERYGVEVKIVTLLEETKKISDETTETDTPTILTFIAMNHAKNGR
jgi:hypothetical protein